MDISKNNKAKQLFTICLTFFLCFMIGFSSLAYAADPKAPSKVRSIQHDFFMTVIKKKISEGQSIISDPTGEQELARKKLNYNILRGVEKGKHSLYDRFGLGGNFSRYFGEKIITTGFVDNCYDLIVHKKDSKLSIKDVVDLLTRQNTQYLNRFYPNRPELKAETDPRTMLYDSVGGLPTVESGSLALANLTYVQAKNLVEVTMLFASPTLPKSFASLMKEFFKAAKPLIQTLERVMTPILAIALLIYIVRSFILVFRGKRGFKEMFLRIGSALFSFLLIFAVLHNQDTFIDIATKVMTFGENIVNTSISFTTKGDKAIDSDDTSHLIEATIWKHALFKPWVQGTFGGHTYEEMEDDKWGLSDTSKKMIGKPTVSLGADSVDNWAALAYSCSSIYHVPSNFKNKKLSDKPTKDALSRWPYAPTLGKQQHVYPDDLRWEDAFLKVGDYGDNDPSPLLPYVNYNQYVFSAGTYAGNALRYAILLFPIIIIGYRKTKYSILCLYSGVNLVVKSVVNVFSPEDEQYALTKTIKNIVSNFSLYFWNMILIMLLLVFYAKFGAVEDIFQELFFVIVSIYLMKLRPADFKNLKKTKSIVKNKVKQIYDSRKKVKHFRSLKELAETRAEVGDKKVIEKAQADSKETKHYKEEFADVNGIPSILDSHYSKVPGLPKEYEPFLSKLTSVPYEARGEVINEWRADRQHRIWDKKYFNILENQCASKIFRTQPNPKKEKDKRDNHLSDTEIEREQLSLDIYKMHRDIHNGKLTDKQDIRKRQQDLRKRAKKYKKKVKANTFNQNSARFMKKLGFAEPKIPMTVKLHILGGALIVYALYTVFIVLVGI